MQIRESSDNTYFYRVRAEQFDEYGILLGETNYPFSDNEWHLAQQHASNRVAMGERVQIIRYVPMGSTGENRYK